MKTWLVRFVALAAFLLFGWILDRFLEPLGLRWVVWTLGGAVLAFAALELVLRGRRTRREDADWRRWREAMDDRGKRREAIREVRSRLDATRRLGPRFRVRQARLATTLAELHLAEGNAEAAVRELAKVPVADLEPIHAAVVRLARAQAHLHRGAADEAAITLDQVPERAGDPVLDASLVLARGAVALEEGRVDDALAAAARIEEAAEPHDELWDEAKALHAACLIERGDPDGAAARLDEIDEAGRRRLAQLGSARVRALL